MLVVSLIVALAAESDDTKERAWSLVNLIAGGIVGGIAGYITGKSGA